LLEQFGDHQRYKDTYFFSGTYFTGDGALRDEVDYRITGRVDDVGHNLVTLLLRTINEHPQLPKKVLLLVFHMTSKGTLYGYVILKKAEKLEGKPV
jgi:acetyl-CoA synthetase